MSIRGWTLLAAAPIVCFALGLVAGRSTAHPRVETRTETVTVEKRVEVAAKVADTATKADQGVQWRERVVYRKGGTVVVTREVVRRDEHEASTHAAETHVATSEHAGVTSTVRIVEPPRAAQWALGAFAGLGLDGGRHAGGEVSRRILGPLWLGVKVDATARAAMLSARLEF